MKIKDDNIEELFKKHKRAIECRKMCGLSPDKLVEQGFNLDGSVILRQTKKSRGKDIVYVEF